MLNDGLNIFFSIHFRNVLSMYDGTHVLLLYYNRVFSLATLLPKFGKFGVCGWRAMGRKHVSGTF